MYLHFISLLHTMDNRNPSSYKTRTYLLYIVNIMVADVLSTPGADYQQPRYCPS